MELKIKQLGVQPATPLMLPSHQGLEKSLGDYSGLITYLKEMDEDRYSKLCAVRLVGIASSIHTDFNLGLFWNS